MTSPIASSSSVDHASVASYASIVRGWRGSAPIERGPRASAGAGSVAVAAMSLRMGLPPAEVRAHLRGEALAALDVVRELVEARAGRRQHDGVARLRQRDRARDGAIQHRHVLDRDLDA